MIINKKNSNKNIRIYVETSKSRKTMNRKEERLDYSAY